MSRIFETPVYPYRRSGDQDANQAIRHSAVIVGAGPVGLALAIDLAIQGVPVVVLDDNDKVSFGSRAICFAKRTLEIMGRLGCADPQCVRGRFRCEPQSPRRRRCCADRTNRARDVISAGRMRNACADADPKAHFISGRERTQKLRATAALRFRHREARRQRRGTGMKR